MSRRLGSSLPGAKLACAILAARKATVYFDHCTTQVKLIQVLT